MDELNIKDLENVQGGVVTNHYTDQPTNPGARPGQQAVIHSSRLIPLYNKYPVETWTWTGNMWICGSQGWSEEPGNDEVVYQ